MRRRWVVSPDYRSAIEVIKQARVERGLSQRAFAERLGKPRSFPSKIETLERRLDIVEFVVIARALELDPGDLINRVAAVLPDKIDI